MLELVADVGEGHSRAPKTFELFVAYSTKHDGGWPVQVTIADSEMQSSRLYFSSGFVPDSYAKMTRLMCWGSFVGGMAVMWGMWWWLV